MPDKDPLEDHCAVTDAAAALRNAQLPVARLPPEILHAIFAILSTIDSLLHSPKTPKCRLAWMAVTHVCQRWRHIALHRPTLWAHNIALPFPRGDRWLEAFLTRAHDAPLNVHASCGVLPMKSSDVAHLSAIVARTQVLHLEGPHPIFPALSSPAPLLHTLEFYQTLTVPADMLSEELLGGPAGTPRLRHLQVSTWTALPWTWSRLEQLVSLALIQQERVESLSEVLSGLGRMRALEKLLLYSSISTVDEEPNRVVTLEKMRRLHIYMDPAEARVLLTHLALPADVQVAWNLLRGDDVEPAAFSSALSASFPALSACISTRASPIVRVHVEPYIWANSQQVRVKAWRAGDALGAPAAEVAVPGPADGPYLAQAALEAFAAEHLEELTVRSAVRKSMWLAPLQRASRLRRIVLADAAAAHSLCAALGHAPGFLPALSALVIAGVDFTERWTGGDSDVTGGMLAETLPLCLAERARAGHALWLLGVEGCGVDAAWVGELEGMVPGLVVRYGEAPC